MLYLLLLFPVSLHTSMQDNTKYLLSAYIIFGASPWFIDAYKAIKDGIYDKRIYIAILIIVAGTCFLLV